MWTYSEREDILALQPSFPSDSLAYYVFLHSPSIECPPFHFFLARQFGHRPRSYNAQEQYSVNKTTHLNIFKTETQAALLHCIWRKGRIPSWNKYSQCSAPTQEYIGKLNTQATCTGNAMLLPLTATKASLASKLVLCTPAFMNLLS